jgi:hypothetical protein
VITCSIVIAYTAATYISVANACNAVNEFIPPTFIAESIVAHAVITDVHAHTVQILTSSAMIFITVVTVVHTTTAICFSVNLVCFAFVANESSAVGASQQAATINVICDGVFFAAPDADGVMTDTEHIFIFASLDDRKSAVVKVLIVTIMGARRANEATCGRRSTLQSPQVGELEDDGHDFLNDTTIGCVNVIAFTVIALGVKSTLHELIFAVMEHLAVDLRLIPVFISLVVGVNGVEYHAGRVEHIGHSARAVLSMVCIRHITNILRIDCVAGCPAVAERHGEIIQRIHAEDCVPLNLHGTQRICILCKFLVVVLSMVKTEISADFVDDSRRLLSGTNRNFGDDFCKMIGGSFRDGCLRIVS